MFYNLIIVTNEIIDENILKDFSYLIINDNVVIDDLRFIYQENQIYFDYLLTSKKIDLDLLQEDNYIITNQYFESSVDNIYAFGKIVNSFKTIDEQIKIIIDHIKNPFD